MRIYATLIALASLAGCSTHSDPSLAIQPELQAATQAFQAGNSESAFQTLDSLIAEHPGASAAYNTLAQLRRQTGDLNASLTAFQHVARLTPNAAPAHFNLGIAYGLLDRLDEAFAALQRAKDEGFNVLNAAASPAAAQLMADNRFRDLVPTPAEYADPFVEGTEIIHDWTGENPQDQFGWIARTIGDVDGDGILDAVSSAPTHSGSAPAAGKIYVYSGGSGDLLWTASGIEAGGQLGFGVERAGDVNADGTPDVVAGAPFANSVVVFSGLDGEVLHTFSGQDPTGGFGASVRGIGDADGDGHDDVLVGEPFQIFGGPVGSGSMNEPGRVHLFSGRTGEALSTLTIEQAGAGFGSTLAGKQTDQGAVFVVGAPAAGDAGTGQAFVYQNLNPKPTFVLEPGPTAVSFGAMFMSVMGDANGDGTEDIYVSDWADGALGASTGRIYVFSGADGSVLHQMGGEAPGDGFGIGVSDAGDVDGDGHADLVVGAWQHSSSAPSGGKLYVISGRSGGLMHTVTGKVMGETLGFDTTGIGDVNGDGTVDFLVTSAWSGINGFQSGRTLVISGRNP